MRYRAAAVVLALAAAVAIGQVPMYSDYPWGLLNNGVDQGPVYNLNCKPPLWCSIPSTGDGVIQLGDGGTLPIIVAYAMDSGFANSAAVADLALYARDSGFADLSAQSFFAFDAGFAYTSGSAGTAGYAFDAGQANYAPTAGYAASAGTATTALTADVAAYAFDAGRANYADTAGTAAYALDAGRANYADTAGTAAYALDAGQANYAPTAGAAATAGTAAYALDAGRANYADSAGAAGAAAVATYALDAGNVVCLGCIVADRIGLAAVIREKIQAGAVNHTVIEDGGILGNNIIPGGVTSTQIATGGVATANIAAGAVTANEIGALAVTEAKINTGAVTNTKLGDLAVSTGKLQDLAVSTGKLNDLAVTEGKIGALAVTNGKLGDLSISTGKLQDLAVSTGKLNDLAVTEGKLGAASVSNTKLADLAVSSGKLQDSAVIEAKIATSAVTTSKVAINAITYPKLDNGAPFMAWDEGRGALLSDRVTYTNAGTKQTPEANQGYTSWTVTSGATDFYVETNIQFRTSKDRFASITYRTNGTTGWSSSSTMRVSNMANAAQQATATMYGDGNWHTAIFDISAWTGTNTIRFDPQDGGSAIGSGASFWVSHVATGTVGPGAGGGNALVNYRGNVGVGTAIPGNATHVVTGNVDGLRVESSNSGYLEVGKTGNQRWRWANDYTAANLFELLIGTSGAAPATSLMTVDSNGKLGIGTTNPAQKLQVGDGTGQQIIRVAGADSGTNNGSAVVFGAGTSGTNVYAIGHYSVIYGGSYDDKMTIFTGGKDLLLAPSGGNVSVGTTSTGEEKLEVRTAASVYGLLHSDGTRKVGSYVDTTGGWYGTKSNHDLHLFTNNGAKRLTVTTGGNIDIASFGTPGSETHVCSDTTGVLVLCSSSDERKKEKIETLSSTLRLVLQLRPVQYEWKDKGRMGKGQDVGFLAQEVMPLFPELVGLNSDGTYLLHYDKFAPILVSAIQELYEDRTWLARRVQALEDKAEATEKRLADLEARLAKLEAK